MSSFTAEAVKTVLAWQLRQAMEAQGVTKSEDGGPHSDQPRPTGPAARSEQPTKVQLDTLKRAAAAVGRKIS